MSAGRKPEGIVGLPQEPLGGRGHAADAPHLPGGELSVAVHALEPGGRVTFGLNGTGGENLPAQVSAALRGGGGMQLVKGNGIHLNAQVDAVQQRAGYPAAVLPHRAG